MKRIIFLALIFLFTIGAASAVSPSEIQTGLHSFQDMHKYSINSSDLIKTYQNDSQFDACILYDGNSVGAGEGVTFLVNGVSYTRQTDTDGIATLNINLKPGNYIIVTEYESCKTYNNILVLQESI
jgi:hypothetical protein